MLTGTGAMSIGGTAEGMAGDEPRTGELDEAGDVGRGDARGP